MRTYDLTPYFRTSIGFDRFANHVDAGARRDGHDGSYPPYNIEKVGETDYRLTMAVAGFGADDLEVTQQESRLLITGRGLSECEGARYLHRGIARRAFERSFELADGVKVSGASLENGLLVIDLVREIPEALKPRLIAIENTGRRGSKKIERKVA